MLGTTHAMHVMGLDYSIFLLQWIRTPLLQVVRNKINLKRTSQKNKQTKRMKGCLPLGQSRQLITYFLILLNQIAMLRCFTSVSISVYIKPEKCKICQIWNYGMVLKYKLQSLLMLWDILGGIVKWGHGQLRNESVCPGVRNSTGLPSAVA